MGRLKTFRKYILWLIGFAIFSWLCTYIGFNSTYKSMESYEIVPNEIDVVVAQSTKVNGRIYGEITNNLQSDFNGKYIKVEILNKNEKVVATKYLKIENAKINEPKKFAVNFTAENIKYYRMKIIDENAKNREEIEKAENLFKDVFTNEELKQYIIVGLLLRLII